jgi:hypothetical protein
MLGERQIISCAVACCNASGEPELYFVRVQCTQDEYENGDHYDAACAAAEAAGYEGWRHKISEAWVCDENDPAFAMISTQEGFRNAPLVQTSDS